MVQIGRTWCSEDAHDLKNWKFRLNFKIEIEIKIDISKLLKT